MGKVTQNKQVFGKYSIIPFDEFETFLEPAKLIINPLMHSSH